MMDKYLKKIGFRGKVEKSKGSLDQLVQAQLTHVPFENLDIWAKGACPSLEREDLYEKIVIRNRGGYCFELNTLFRQLLEYLGFEAYQAVSSLVDEAGNAFPAAHNVIICTLDGQKYLIDVGYGGPVPFGAMPLTEGPWENFRLRQQEGFWYLDRLEDGNYRNSIRFRDMPASLAELIPLNFYVSQNPGIHFRHRLNVSMKQPDGTICRLLGDQLHVRTADSVVDKTVTREEVPAILLEHFGIAYFDIPRERPLCEEY